MKNLIKQLFKFGIVGVICFLIDYILLILFTDVFDINYLISSALSFSISTVINYLISVTWVFKVNKDNSKKNFITFVVGSIIGLIITEVIMYIGIDIFNINYKFVKIIATCIVMVFNFITRKIFLEKK